jgi:O-methyltransferase
VRRVCGIVSIATGGYPDIKRFTRPRRVILRKKHLMSTTLRLVGHVGRLAKSLGVAGYQTALFWSTERERRIEHCFSSAHIHLDDAYRLSRLLHRGYRDEENVKAIIPAIKSNTMVGYEGIATLFDQARYCDERRLDGAFVELGTWKGGCLGAMALANLAFSTERRNLHGFDSFQGIPMPRADKDDLSWAQSEFNLSVEECDGALQPANQLQAAREDVENLFSAIGYPRERLFLHAGWFQDTVPRDAPTLGPIAILRIDGDLYDSYVVALDHLWNNVVTGGFVIFDDWILKGCRDAVSEFLDRQGIRPYLAHVDDSIRYLQKT